MVPAAGHGEQRGHGVDVRRAEHAERVLEDRALDPGFIAATGLQASLTPSRANGFLNILRLMQAVVKAISDATLLKTICWM